MNRSTRTFVVVLIAIGVAALASFGVFRAIQRMPVREVEVRSRYQVIAVHDLEMGKRITKDDVKLVPWPASSPVENGFTTIEAVLNRGLIAGVVTNEPLTESKVAPLEAGAGLPPSITEGMRALAIKVNEVIGVAGFIVPGAHVDVIVTLSQRGNNNESMTRVVVSDVEVLTAGPQYDKEKSRDAQRIPTNVVTLLVTPSDAEKIALAANEGSIILTLRNPLDRAPTQTTGIRTAALLGQPPAPPPVVKAGGVRRAIVSPPPPAPEPKPYTVEAIRGAQRKEEVIK